jgi:ATP-dependent DNA helicase PIF1
LYADVILIEEQLKIYALADIELLLQSSRTSLSNFSLMPTANPSLIPDLQNRLIHDEMNYDMGVLADEHDRLMSTMTSEQRKVYDKITIKVNENKPGLFFLYGCGGTRKTFLWRAMTAPIRFRGEIVIIVASSGIISLLIPSGRTSHSRFGIPLLIDETSTCNIKPKTPMARLIVREKLIIWDEGPMMHKYCFEVVDRSFRDIMKEVDKRNKTHSLWR